MQQTSLVSETESSSSSDYSSDDRQSPHTGRGSGGCAWRSVDDTYTGRRRTHPLSRSGGKGARGKGVPFSLRSKGGWARGYKDVIDNECTCRATWRLWIREFGERIWCMYHHYDQFRWIWIEKDLHILGPIEVDTVMRAIGSQVFRDPPEVYSFAPFDLRSICFNMD